MQPKTRVRPPNRPRSGERKLFPLPMAEGTMGFTPEMKRLGCPKLQLDLASDPHSMNAFFQMARMGMDNFESVGDYVAVMTGLFRDCRRCTVLISPENTFADTQHPALEHRLTVLRRDGTLSIDESGRETNPMFDPALMAFTTMKPMLLDRDPGGGLGHGLKLAFENLRRGDNNGVVSPIERVQGGGMYALMPFYYREPENPSGVALFEGDLRAAGSGLSGFSRAYWGAALAMSASAQISMQLTHRFDAITNLPLRRDFEIDTRECIRRLVNSSGELHLMFIDLDHFKGVNDRFTHPVGDEVLRQAAARIEASVRAEDAVARLGGEEFGVAVAGVPYQTALLIAERIRSNIEAIRVYVTRGADGRVELVRGEPPADAELVRVTCSIGVTNVSDSARTLGISELPPNGRGDGAVNEIYATAYAASANMLHEAKAAGRNRVVYSEGNGYRELQLAV